MFIQSLFVSPFDIRFPEPKVGSSLNPKQCFVSLCAQELVLDYSLAITWYYMSLLYLLLLERACETCERDPTPENPMTHLLLLSPASSLGNRKEAEVGKIYEHIVNAASWLKDHHCDVMRCHGWISVNLGVGACFGSNEVQAHRSPVARAGIWHQITMLISGSWEHSWELVALLRCFPGFRDSSYREAKSWTLWQD